MVLAELRAVAFVEDEDDALGRKRGQQLAVGLLVLAQALGVAGAAFVSPTAHREAETAKAHRG